LKVILTKVFFKSRKSFFEENDLDIQNGISVILGMIFTSPLDQYYVEDLAKSVIELNNQGYLGILYENVQLILRIDTMPFSKIQGSNCTVILLETN
jgi:hypothetical protein